MNHLSPSTNIDQLPPWLCTQTAPASATETFEIRMRRIIPKFMQEAPRWLVHKSKIPYYPDGTPRNGKLDSPEDTARLGTFENALARYRTGNFSGLGFALGAGWQGIDLDKVEANGLTSLVAELPGYVEQSPSGKGWHAIGHGRDFATFGAKKSGIEAYCSQRFFTITGNQGRGNIQCIADFVESQLAPLHSSATSTPRNASFTSGIDIIEGNRNATLTSLAGHMRMRGFGEAAIEAALLAENNERCKPPLPEPEVKRIAKSVARYPIQNDAALEDVSPLFSSVVNEWPEPTPLPNALPPVDAFNAELLPEALRPWVMDIAHRMQCPPDFPGVGAMVALSSIIGARAVVQPKAQDDWQVVPNLWGMIVGRPGIMKSPALSEVLKPLKRLQATEYERCRIDHDAWAVEMKLGAFQSTDREQKAKELASKDPSAARELLKQMDKPIEPIARSFIINDATVEKLGELLNENQWGTLCFRDELYGLFTSMDRQGQESARTFYLQSYDGDKEYTFHRIGRGKIHIPRVCLSMLGNIQPGRIQEYIRAAVAGESADDGFLQRFALTVWPDTPGKFVHVDKSPDTVAQQKAWEVFKRLSMLKPASDTEPVIWRFNDDAQALFVEWRTHLEQELRQGELHPAMESHLAKYRKLIPALALIFALIDTPEGNVIQERELKRAIAWGDFLRSHAERLYAAATVPEISGAQALLTKIMVGKLINQDGVPVDSFTPRQIAVKGWTGLCSPDAVRKAADLLADHDWLRREQIYSKDQSGRGRPSDRYMINPAAKQRQPK